MGAVRTANDKDVPGDQDLPAHPALQPDRAAPHDRASGRGRPGGGAIALKLFAPIDQDDMRWIIPLKGLGPDVSIRTGTLEQTEYPAVFEHEAVRGSLKAFRRALEPERSKPWKPWRKLTQSARQLVAPGKVNACGIKIFAASSMFMKTHRTSIGITCLDLPTGIGGLTGIEYIPCHICSSKTGFRKIYHDEQYPSHLLIPVIPQE